MSSLDKLINLLEKLGQEDPSFHDKAKKALDVLVDDEIEVVEEPSAEPKYKIRDGKLVSGTLDLDATPPQEEEPFDDSYVEVSNEDLQTVISTREAAVDLIKALGLLTQNYEADKERVLEEIEANNSFMNQFVSELKISYNLDPNAGYTLVLPSPGQEKGAFVKAPSS